MGLIHCPDCGATVSDAAVACLSCGRPIAAADPLQQLAVAGQQPVHSNRRRPPVAKFHDPFRWPRLLCLLVAGASELLPAFNHQPPSPGGIRLSWFFAGLWIILGIIGMAMKSAWRANSGR